MTLSHKQMHMNPVHLQLSAPLQYQILNKEQKHKPNNFKKTKSERKIEYDRGLSFLKDDDEIIAEVVLEKKTDSINEGKATQNSSKLERRQSGTIIYKVSSGVSISELGIEQIKQAEETLLKDIGPDYGFDVKQIGRFYFYFFNFIVFFNVFQFYVFFLEILTKSLFLLIFICFFIIF